ncbi:fatty acyl-CoA reductase 1-like [Haliotis rufescens]|uniref:fatty acyl-CoA reductase 1-like n=1 Tax=Haliotis rufescens TaxID=6454 RepID=UPI001EB04F03|nr:fatty acyl-CoA reductase 1-like [Haliotis rufescens]XP_046335729.1 fatty acyl-CoA reductase 1-like [Haliotis rufescens]
MAGIPSIAEFYDGRSLFITGVTGFMGKVLLEKLLRACPGIRCCYVLIRPKRGQSVAQRLEGLINSKLFNKVKTVTPDFASKVIAVEGDIMEPNFGICEEDERKVCSDVSVVFHSAATVKFDEEMKLSVQMNVIGVKRLLELCHKIDKLDAVIHVSTAYANCDKETVAEQVYEPPLHPQKLVEAVEWMDNAALNVLTKKLVGPRPNTYTYTKAMAEFLLVEGCGQLPVAIVRPSIVGATYKEPLPGWVDNFNGPTGLLAAIGKGVLRIMHGYAHCTADVIPCDIATNLMIAVAWYTGTTKPSRVPVFNNTTGQINKFTWGEMEKLIFDNFMRNPVDVVARVPNPRFTKSIYWKSVNVLFDHILPAYLMDFYMYLIGKKRIFVKIQDRLWKAVTTLEFFTSREWKFDNSNIFMLLDKMSKSDRDTFDFDARHIDWPSYMESYCLGTKQFVLKEELDQLPKARRALYRMKQIQFVINAVLVVVIWRVLVTRVGVARSLWNLVLSWVIWLYQKIPRLGRAS